MKTNEAGKPLTDLKQILLTDRGVEVLKHVCLQICVGILDTQDDPSPREEAVDMKETYEQLILVLKQLLSDSENAVLADFMPKGKGA